MAAILPCDAATGQLNVVRANTDEISACAKHDEAMTLRVVLIDDDPRFRALARRALVAEGIEVVAEAGSGSEGLDAVAQWLPDVALIDIQMPGMTGQEVARQIEESGDGPVVILISTRDQAYGDRLADGVAAGYLPKDRLSLAGILELTGTSE
jgi:DNA-binding NarL/FixJ family response regulator